MSDDATGAPSPLDAEIERQKRTVGSLKEIAVAKPPSDGAWFALRRAEERLDELLRDQRARAGQT